VRLERDSAKSFIWGRDHCPRNYFWGLLYEFCDLVSGGLSWMGYASAKDGSSCQILTEMVMGERGRDDRADDGETTTEGESLPPKIQKQKREETSGCDHAPRALIPSLVTIEEFWIREGEQK